MTDSEVRLRAILEKKILILDGATATLAGDTQCPDLLCITRPEQVYGIHTAYLEAGADIITTNTFNANSFSWNEYSGYKTESINRAASGLAVRAVNNYCSRSKIPAAERPFIAGVIGPGSISLTSLRLEGESEDQFRRMADGYADQASTLIGGGVDIILLETQYDLMNTRAALLGISGAFEKTGVRLPLIISATLNNDGHLYSGERIEEFVKKMQPYTPLAIGINCGGGPELMNPYIKIIKGMTDSYVSYYPNAGQPDKNGKYPVDPEKFIQYISDLIREGNINIAGGCCGTTPLYIKLLAETVRSCGRSLRGN